MLIGYMDGDSGELHGWALDTDAPDEPQLLTVRVNGQAMASVLAAMHRGDVAKAHGTRGYHGFGINLSRVVPPSPSVVVDVRLPNGRPLGRSPLRMQVPASAPDQPTLVFMHVPKTAGTAFRERAEMAFLPSERLYLYPHDTYYPGRFTAWLLPIDHRARIRFVSGHVPFGLHEAIPRPVEYVTLLRPAFDRVRSHYRHMQRHSPDDLVVGGRVQTLSALLEDPPSAAFDNLMVRYFSGVDVHACPPGHVGAEQLETALRNMRAHFVFVGTQEHADAAYQAISRRYGWQTTTSLNRINVAPGDMPLADEDDAREAALRRERWDAQLFDEATRMFASA